MVNLLVVLHLLTTLLMLLHPLLLLPLLQWLHPLLLLQLLLQLQVSRHPALRQVLLNPLPLLIRLLLKRMMPARMNLVLLLFMLLLFKLVFSFLQLLHTLWLKVVCNSVNHSLIPTTFSPAHKLPCNTSNKVLTTINAVYVIL